MNMQEQQEVRPLEGSIDRDILRKHLSRLGSRRGMSLIEVMVVIAIILMLMGVITVGVMTGLANSQQQTTKISMTRIAQQVQLHVLMNKSVPSSLGEVFTDEEVPRDAWNNEFKLEPGGSGNAEFDLISFGADGQAGGDGKNADLKWSEIKNE